jgi:hypothetical protein
MATLGNLFPFLLFIFAIGFFLPAFTPGITAARRWGYMALQVVLAILGLALGWSVIGPAMWDASGGCAAHGGNFEGACGFGGVATLAVAAIFTAGIITTISGVVFFLRGVWAKKQGTPYVDGCSGRA